MNEKRLPAHWVGHRAIFRAFFEHGRDIGQPEVLLELAAAVGLDPEALRAVLAQDRYTEQVLHDQRLAQELGISAVPTMLLRQSNARWHEGRGVSGALPYEQVHSIVEHVRRTG